MALYAKATKDEDNVLRSFDGKAFQVRVIVVDISGSTNVSDIKGSASIAIAGAGKLLGADASDPTAERWRSLTTTMDDSKASSDDATRRAASRIPSAGSATPCARAASGRVTASCC